MKRQIANKLVKIANKLIGDNSYFTHEPHLVMPENFNIIKYDTDNIDLLRLTYDMPINRYHELKNGPINHLDVVKDEFVNIISKNLVERFGNNIKFYPKRDDGVFNAVTYEITIPICRQVR